MWMWLETDLYKETYYFDVKTLLSCVPYFCVFLSFYVLTSSLHLGLSPDLQTFDQIKSIARPTDVPDTGNEKFLYTIALLLLLRRYI